MKNSIFRFLSVICVFVALAAPVTGARADAGPTPPMPAPLKTLADQGAQVRFMGKANGMDSWLTIKGGQEQYFYVTPDGEAMVMGLMFGTDGRLITLQQVRDLQAEAGGVLDMFAAPAAPEAETPNKLSTDELKVKPQSERLMEDIESSNWLALGKDTAPPVYAFIDPQCPHCHDFIQDLRENYLPNGMIQVRMIPVGFRDETKAQAAFMLAAPDAAQRFLRHLDGEKNALPVSYDINQQGVERNLSIMQGWRLNVTPLIVYRAKDGTVKIVQGRPKDLPKMIAELPQSGAAPAPKTTANPDENQ
jgi:protein-disulfide isomerase